MLYNNLHHCLVTLLIVLLSFSVLAKKDVNVIPSKLSSLVFVENKGQVTDQYRHTRNDIDFKLEANNVTAFIGDAAMHYQWKKITGNRNDSFNQISTISTHRMDVVLVGANKDAEVIAMEPTGYYEYYYTPELPQGVKVNSYRKIIYKEVYPGIDWVLYTNPGKKAPLKYDFVVHPGGDVKQIQLEYSGFTTLKLVDGNLVATTGYGTVIEERPFTYHSESGVEIASAFKIDGNKVSFAIEGTHDNIVIDPGLSMSTYFGDYEEDLASGIAVSKDHKVYIVGLTNSNNIATGGVHDNVYDDSTDIYIARFDEGGELVWCSYYGGGNHEWSASIDVDTDGFVYVAGATTSAGMATPNTEQPKQPIKNFGNQHTALLLKMDSTGQRVWATYYGGARNNIFTSIATDKYGHIYLVGETEDEPGFSTPGTFQAKGFPAYVNGFIAKFATSTGKRIWGSYYSGTENDWLSSIEVSDDGTQLCISGSTDSKDTMSSLGAFQVKNAGQQDGFLAVFDSSGNRQWGTYFGTSGSHQYSDDHFSDAVFDKNGNIYAVGSSVEADSSIVSPGSFKDTFTGYRNAWLVKFSNSGTMRWSTYYGTDNSAAYDVAIDATGGIYIYGVTKDDNGIAAGNVIGDTLKGVREDVFIAKFDENGSRKWGGYYGSSKLEQLRPYGGRQTLIHGNLLYFCGRTYGDDLPITAGAHQDSLGGMSDAFLASIWLIDTTLVITEPFYDTMKCRGDSLVVNYVNNFEYKPGNIFTVQLSDTSGGFNSPVNIGSKLSITKGAVQCIIPANTAIGNNYLIRIISTAPMDTYTLAGSRIHINKMPEPIATANTPVCEGETLMLSADNNTGGTAYQWLGPDGTTYTGKNVTVPTVLKTQKGQYIVTLKQYGCVARDTVVVDLIELPRAITLNGNTPICEGDSLLLIATDTSTGVVYKWIGPQGFTSNNAKTAFIYPVDASHSGIYSIKANRPECTATVSDSILVAVNIKPLKPVATSNSPVNINDNLELTATTADSGVSYSWQGPDGFTSIVRAPIIYNVKFEHSGKYILHTYLNGCASSDTINVVINDVADTCKFVIYANPNEGNFILKGVSRFNTAFPYEILSVTGHIVARGEVIPQEHIVEAAFELKGRIWSGVYFMRIAVCKGTVVIPFTVVNQ